MKKVLMLIMVLLALFVIVPVMAAPAAKTPFTAEVTMTFNAPGKEWMTEHGIYHVRDQEATGRVTGGISGDMVLVRHMILDLNTGKGSCHGKFVITVDGGGTFVGSEQSKITNGAALPDGISGSLVAHGAGKYEGVKIMGSFEGGRTGEVTIELTLEGIILSPQG